MRGLTLIELLISIAITAVITGAIYFSLNAALESWEYTKDQLALQKVLGEVAEKITAGTVTAFSLKDSLEILTAGKARVEYVPPWTDDTHTATERDFIYTLNCRIKPGTGVPIAEVRLSGSENYYFVPTAVVEGESERSLVMLKQNVPRASQIRFTYRPDPEANPKVIKYIWWDPGEKSVFSEYKDEILDISKNPFGVEVTDLELRYYDRANNLVTESEWVDKGNLNLISGIEIILEVRLGQYKKKLMSFVSLRNSPMRSGYLPLSEGMEVPVPDSDTVHTLYLKNISGVSNEDVLQLEAKPDSGKAWRIKIVFSRVGAAEPKIGRYVIEYPPGYPVYTEYPETDIDTGLNLLTLGSSGRYDYDDDEEIEDVVLLKGDVVLAVKRMDIEGAGLFIRP